MRTSLLILTAVVLTAATLTGIVDELGITASEAKERLLKSMATGIIYHTSEIKQKAKALSVDMQVQGVRELISMAKAYSESAEFTSDYKKWRKEKLNPDGKTKLGLPKLGKMLDNAIDNTLDKKANEVKYPSDLKLLVKKRLQDFLAVSANVDFDADVVKGKFVNEEYERKSPEWKMCYRAGKEVVMAARQEAEKWLNQL